MRITRDIETRIQRVSPAFRDQLLKFLDSLITKRTKENKKSLKQNWAGALRDFRDKYTALQLQKKSLDWRY